MMRELKLLDFVIVLMLLTMTFFFGVLMHASVSEMQQSPEVAYLTEKVQEERERYEDERQMSIYWKSQYFACVHEQTDPRTQVVLLE